MAALRIRGAVPGHIIIDRPPTNITQDQANQMGEEDAAALFQYLWGHINFKRIIVPFMKIVLSRVPNWREEI